MKSKCLAMLLTLLFLCAGTVLQAQQSAESFAATKTKAEKGDAIAQFNLGWNYAEGVGVAKDEVEAVKWYRKAAEQGNDGGSLILV